VTLSLLVFSGIALLLALLLIVLLRDPEKASQFGSDLTSNEESGPRHVTFFPQIRQALAPEDYAFLARRGSRELRRRVRKDRRKIALVYLSLLRKEFTRLWKLARVIAAMSVRVGAGQELARFRLGIAFYMRYEVIRLQLLFGLGPIPELGAVSEVVSNLAIRLETAMSSLGERAALESELASTLDGSGLHTL
jgi:hypothetical protein